MIYLVPYTVLMKKVGTRSVNGQRRITLTEAELKNLIKLLLRAVEVDEQWYRREYEDVAAAIDAKQYRSAKHHFVEEGYFEGRLPRPLEVDEAWYVQHNKDVAEGLRRGDFASALQHFEEYGYAEERLPAEF